MRAHVIERDYSPNRFRYFEMHSGVEDVTLDDVLELAASYSVDSAHVRIVASCDCDTQSPFRHVEVTWLKEHEGTKKR